MQGAPILHVLHPRSVGAGTADTTPHHSTPHLTTLLVVCTLYYRILPYTHSTTTQCRILYFLSSHTLYLLPHRTPSFSPFPTLHLLPSHLVSTDATLSLILYPSSPFLSPPSTSLHSINSSHIVFFIAPVIPFNPYTPLFLHFFFLFKVSSVELITPSVLSVTAEVSHWYNAMNCFDDITHICTAYVGYIPVLIYHEFNDFILMTWYWI